MDPKLCIRSYPPRLERARPCRLPRLPAAGAGGGCRRGPLLPRHSQSRKAASFQRPARISCGLHCLDWAHWLPWLALLASSRNTAHLCRPAGMGNSGEGASVPPLAKRPDGEDRTLWPRTFPARDPGRDRIADDDPHIFGISALWSAG
ncbi:Uncharacterised protein [uncultured archaeon]|nr:Uncharacterised protein [uncultured archaeon]